MNGNFIVVVTDNDGKVVVSKVFQLKKFNSLESYEKAISKYLGRLEREYPEKDYTIQQGSASSVSSFFTVYPELAGRMKNVKAPLRG